jgi:glycosyltransferase involved in cell wall biosynthesis
MDFSILICVYDKDDHILFQKAIKSILENSILPKEIVLIIDGKINTQLMHTINFIKKNNLFKTYQLNQNVGLAKALNFGLKKIKTPIVIRADADDINVSNRFKKLVDKFKTGNFDVVGSYIIERDIQKKINITKKVPLENSQIIKMSKIRNPVNHMSVAFKAKSVIDLGGYPEIDLKEDYALWLKMISNNCTFSNIPESLVVANAGESMIKRRTSIKSLTGELSLFMFRKNKTLKDFIVFLFRIIFHFMPFTLRKVIFKNFLRR